MNRTEDGQKTIKYYERVKKFDHCDRLELVKLIVDYIFAVNYKMGIKQFKEISHQISMVFVNEDKVFIPVEFFIRILW